MTGAIFQLVLFLLGLVVLIMLGSFLRWRLHRRHITLRKHGRRKS